MGHDKGTPPSLVTPTTQRRHGIFLRSHREIQTVKRHGRRLSTALFNILACKMDDAPSRIGIVVGKRFGNAVRRNRAKRVFRELVRESYSELASGLGVLIFPKKELFLSSRKDLIQAWNASLQRMHLFRPH